MNEFDVVVTMLVEQVTRQKVVRDGVVSRPLDDPLGVASARVFDLVTTKLQDDPALGRLRLEATNSGEVAVRTANRVRMSLEEAAEDDPEFAEEFDAAVLAAREVLGLPAQDFGSVVNQISGVVGGNVVQARNIGGNISF